MNHVKITSLAFATIAAIGITLSGGSAEARLAAPTKVAGFAAMDANGDGLISLAEMRLSHAKHAEARKARKATLSRGKAKAHKNKKAHKNNKARKASNKARKARKAATRDARRPRRVRMTVAQRFARLDRNHNGTITPAELAWARNNRKAPATKRPIKAAPKGTWVRPPATRPATPPARPRTVIRPTPQTRNTASVKVSAKLKLSL